MSVYTATLLDASSPTPIPLASVIALGTNTTTPTEGGPSVANSGNPVAPVSIYSKDGNNLTLGTTTQTKATDGSTTAWSVIQLLKGIFDFVKFNNVSVQGNFFQATQPVSGTFWQATQPVSGTFWQATQPVTPQAGASGGATPSHTISAASTNATSTKASAGVLWGVDIANVNAAVRFVKFYNKASAPTVGTDTPVKVFEIPANGSYARAFPAGLNFTTGIAWATTTGIANADTGAVGAADLSIDFEWQ